MDAGAPARSAAMAAGCARTRAPPATYTRLPCQWSQWWCVSTSVRIGASKRRAANAATASADDRRAWASTTSTSPPRSTSTALQSGCGPGRATATTTPSATSRKVNDPTAARLACMVRTQAYGPEGLVVPADEARRLVVDLLTAHAGPAADAATIARCLVRADLRGVDSHGITRVPGYLDRLRRGLVRPDPVLEPVRVAVAAA